MYLQSKDLFDLVIEFDKDVGIIKKISKANKKIKSKIQGTFSEYNSVLFAVFVENNKIYFFYNNKILDLSKSFNIYAEGLPKDRKLIIEKDNKPFDTISYSTKIEDSVSENDPTPFIEDEDFDFGLFVSNISNDLKRQKVMLEYYQA